MHTLYTTVYTYITSIGDVSLQALEEYIHSGIQHMEAPYVLPNSGIYSKIHSDIHSIDRYTLIDRCIIEIFSCDLYAELSDLLQSLSDKNISSHDVEERTTLKYITEQIYIQSIDCIARFKETCALLQLLTFEPTVARHNSTTSLNTLV